MRKLLVLLPLLTSLGVLAAYSQNTPHSASTPFTDSGSGITSFNCYKSANTGGPYVKYASVATSPCVDSSPGGAGTTTFYVETALAGSNESVFSNEVSGVAIGNPNPPQAQAVIEK